MCFYPDCSTFTLDVFFLMFLYRLVGGGVSYTLSPSYAKEIDKRKLEGTLIFPFLISGAADKISAYLDECVGEVPSLKESELTVSAKSLRKGALQECALRNVHDAGVYRGHWVDSQSATQSKNSDIYMEGCTELLKIAGLALSGYDNPRVHLHLPTCEAFLETMKDDERQKFSNFLTNVTSGPFDISTNQSHLQQLGYHMFTSFLRWYPMFIDEYGSNHCTFDKLKSAMVTFEYSWEQLTAWSDLVRKDFLVKNGKIFGYSTFKTGDEDAVSESIYAPQILGVLLQITKHQTATTKAIDELSKRLSKVERIVSDVHDTAR